MKGASERRGGQRQCTCADERPLPGDRQDQACDAQHRDQGDQRQGDCVIENDAACHARRDRQERRRR